MNMNSIKCMNLLIDFLRSKNCKVYIKQNPRRKTSPNGGFDRNYNTIDIICRDRDEEADEICAYLIHEYGHYVCTEAMGHWHYCCTNEELIREETRAWVEGRKAVPANLVPKCYKKVKKDSLDLYRLYYKRETDNNRVVETSHKK